MTDSTSNTVVHYKIVETWQNDNIVVARFWTDKLSEESLASDGNRNADGTPVRCRTDVSVNVPIPAPTGANLALFIESHAPIEWLKMIEQVRDPNVNTSIDHITAMIGQVTSKTADEMRPAPQIVPQETTPAKGVSESDIETLLKSLKN